VKKISVFILFLAFLSTSFNVFAGGYTIQDISNKKKILKYDDSKVAELKYVGGWKVFCEKGRKRGSVSTRFDTLKVATINAMSVCKKY